ncbi:MAG TPA: response regulator, partial [Polyangiaceae bacterium]
MSTKVLVFESDAAFAGELRSELAKLGCETAVVDDGNAGLQQAASDKPDLILLSIELPRMNGFSVCNKLKKDGKLKDVPLIIMSTESSEETFEQHKKLRTRAEDYVHKPIAFGELLQHINQFVKLEGGSGVDEDGGIVIDDEISSIDIEEEGTLVVEEKPVAPPPAPTRGSGSVAPARAAAPVQSEPPAKLKNVDDDIDAFIEGGFGKMTGAPGEAKANGAQALSSSGGEVVEQAPA